MCSSNWNFETTLRVSCIYTYININKYVIVITNFILFNRILYIIDNNLRRYTYLITLYPAPYKIKLLGKRSRYDLRNVRRLWLPQCKLCVNTYTCHTRLLTFARETIINARNNKTIRMFFSVWRTDHFMRRESANGRETISS